MNSNSEEIVLKSKSNFVSSFYFLSKEKREALNTVYAYCRLTDDIVDEGSLAKGEKEAAKTLEEWKEKTFFAFKGKSDHPVLQELFKVVEKYKIPEDYFLELIEGVGLDLQKKSFLNFEELYPYCYKVASIVGLICLEIFSYKNKKSKDYAIHLGVAFQLTNILRDIRSDAKQNRVYIPEVELKNFGLERKDILSLSSGCNLFKEEKLENFKAMIEFQCDRAQSYYERAKENLTEEDRSRLVAAEVMRSIYYAIFINIKKKCVFFLLKILEFNFSCFLKNNNNDN